MKINENYRLDYDMDDIHIQKREGDAWHDLCSISETAAMVWEGIERGIARDKLIEAVMNEFDGADEATVGADMDGLIDQLSALGIVEP